MTEPEDRDFAALDAYVRSQLAKAAETYAPHADLDARLAAALKAVKQEDEDLTVPGKLGGARHPAPEQRRNAAQGPAALPGSRLGRRPAPRSMAATIAPPSVRRCRLP